MYAIIETGGKQLRVEPGRFYDIDRLAVDESAKVSIDKVLYVQADDEIHVGQPLVTGAIVEGTVLRHLRGRKIIVYKMRPKKKTRKKQGHRQELTRLLIDSISLDGVELGRSNESEPGASASVIEPETEPETVATESDVEPEAVAATVETELEIEGVEPTAVASETASETETPETEPETAADELSK